MTLPRRRPRLAVVVVAALCALAVVPAEAAVTTGGPGAPTYTNFAAPAPLGQDSGEPSIGSNHKTDRVLFQAELDTLQVTFANPSSAAPTASWKDVSFVTTNALTIDPILFTDSTTGRTFVSQLAPPCSASAFTDSDGEPPAPLVPAYTPSTGCGPGANLDHQTISAGPSKTATSTYGGNRLVHYCSQVGVNAFCVRSFDGGITFPASAATYTLPGVPGAPDPLTCAGLHGHHEVGPNGTLYLPNFSCTVGNQTKPAVLVSLNDGLTYEPPRLVPDGTSPEFDSDPAVGIDAANRMYFAYEDATSNLRVATSDNAGVDWTTSVDLGLPFAIKNAVFPAVVAGSAGRAAVAFLGTAVEAPPDTAGVPENNLRSFRGEWRLYVATTYDGGANWTTVDATPTDPVQRGCIWWENVPPNEIPTGDSTCTSRPDRNLLDFNEVTVDRTGRVLVGYAAGCVRTCVGASPTVNASTAGADFRDDVATIARQQCGRGLFASFDASPEGPANAEGCPAAAGVSPIIPEGPWVPLFALLGAGVAGAVVWRGRRRDGTEGPTPLVA